LVAAPDLAGIRRIGYLWLCGDRRCSAADAADMALRQEFDSFTGEYKNVLAQHSLHELFQCLWGSLGSSDVPRYTRPLPMPARYGHLLALNSRLGFHYTRLEG